MNYILHDTEIERLLKGEISKEQIMSKEHWAIIPCAGIDVIEAGRKRGLDITEDDLETIIDDLDGCDCWLCIDSAIGLLEERKRRKDGAGGDSKVG